MRNKLIYILTAIVLCLAFALSACGGTGGNKEDDGGTYYTVTFDSQGGSAVESQRVLAGNPANAPASPTRDTFDFYGWFRSASEDAARWDFAADRVNENITFYAHWTQKEPPMPTDTLTFTRNTAGEGYLVTGDEGQAVNIVIPAEHGGEPVVGIADSAFAYSRHTSDILSVTIPDSVTEIGKNAFHNQAALVTVLIGADSKLERIGNNAFSGNSALESIYLPAGLTSLGDGVFNNCGALNAITVAEGNAHYSGAGNCLIDLETNTLLRGSNHSVIPVAVQTIGEAAFRRAQMTALTVPKSVTSIEKYAISDSAIAKIFYEGTSDEWDALMASSSAYWNMGNKDVEIVCSDTATDNILIAYFSCTGTTKGVAEKIASVTGGDLYRIEPAVPYTAADLEYSNSSSRATSEQRTPSARPAISGSVEDMARYSVVFLGYPIWWGEAPKIMYTFLETYDFSGKTIVPFCTSGSSQIGNSAVNLKKSASGATWLGGQRFAASVTAEQLESWVGGLGI